ncbi:MAG: P-II family nitrogen regulator [Pseudomonadales bacterium]|jgi:nitrogen regulatory protein P-II 1
MKPCKRIEIVIEKPMAQHLADKLMALGAPGYTCLDHASGQGDRGLRGAYEPTGTETNCVFIVACETAQDAEKVVEGIRPMLSRSGGVCLVSDAYWVQH